MRKHDYRIEGYRYDSVDALIEEIKTYYPDQWFIGDPYDLDGPYCNYCIDLYDKEFQYFAEAICCYEDHGDFVYCYCFEVY